MVQGWDEITLVCWRRFIIKLKVSPNEPQPSCGFSLWEESIVGSNIAFEEGKKIQQKWYFGDREPPSIVSIELHPHKQGWSAELVHTNI